MIKALVILLIILANTIIYFAFAFPQKLEFIGRYKVLKMFLLSCSYFVVSFALIENVFSNLGLTFYLFMWLLIAFHLFPILWKSVTGGNNRYKKLESFVSKIVVPLFVAFVTIVQCMIVFVYR